MSSVVVAVRVWGRGGHTQQPSVSRPWAGKLGDWSAQSCPPGPRTGISPPRDKVHKIPKGRPYNECFFLATEEKMNRSKNSLWKLG